MKRKIQRKSRTSSKRRITGWIAAGALTAHVGMSQDGGLLLHAQQPAGQTRQQPPAPSLQVPPSQFDLAAGPLDSALAAFQGVDRRLQHIGDVVTAVGKVTIEQVMRKIWPFYGVMFFVLMLVTYLPEISLWLPRHVLR